MLSELNSLFPIDIDNPVNKNHPLAKNLVSWWVVVPSITGGIFFYDILGLNTGLLTNMGNGNNGWNKKAKVGGYGSILLDGTAGFINVSNRPSLDLGNTGTISIWVNATSWANNPYILGRQTGATDGTCNYRLEYFSGSLFITLGNGSSSQVGKAFNPLTNTWYNIVAVWNGTLQNLYVNGLQLGTNGAQTIIPAGNNTAMQIGNVTNANAGRFFTGNIDDIKFYTRALSPTEILGLYINSIQKYPNLLNRVGLNNRGILTEYFEWFIGQQKYLSLKVKGP